MSGISQVELLRYTTGLLSFHWHKSARARITSAKMYDVEPSEDSVQYVARLVMPVR